MLISATCTHTYVYAIHVRVKHGHHFGLEVCQPQTPLDIREECRNGPPGLVHAPKCKDCGHRSCILVLWPHTVHAFKTGAKELPFALT